jgi:hypothetical protein
MSIEHSNTDSIFFDGALDDYGFLKPSITSLELEEGPLSVFDPSDSSVWNDSLVQTTTHVGENRAFAMAYSHKQDLFECRPTQPSYSLDVKT